MWNNLGTTSKNLSPSTANHFSKLLEGISLTYTVLSLAVYAFVPVAPNSAIILSYSLAIANEAASLET